MSETKKGRYLGVAQVGVVILGLLTGGIHLILYLSDVIPRESTAGSEVFAVTGVLYILGVVTILMKKTTFLYLFTAYTVIIILIYALTREAAGELLIGERLPIEAVGISTKMVEVGLVACLLYWIKVKKRSIYESP